MAYQPFLFSLFITEKQVFVVELQKMLAFFSFMHYIY